MNYRNLGKVHLQFMEFTDQEESTLTNQKKTRLETWETVSDRARCLGIYVSNSWCFQVRFSDPGDFWA